MSSQSGSTGKQSKTKNRPAKSGRSQIHVRSWSDVVVGTLASGVTTTVMLGSTLWYFNLLHAYAVYAGMAGLVVTVLSFQSELNARRAELRWQSRQRLRRSTPVKPKPGFGETTSYKAFTPTAKRWAVDTSTGIKHSEVSEAGTGSWAFFTGSFTDTSLSEPVKAPEAAAPQTQPSAPTPAAAQPAPKVNEFGADTDFSGELNDHAGRLKTSTESLALNLKLYRLEGEPIQKIKTFKRRVDAMQAELKDVGAVFRLLHRSWCEPVLEQLLRPEQRPEPEKTASEILAFLKEHPECAEVIAQAFALAWIYRKGDKKELRRYLNEEAFDRAVEAFRNFLQPGTRAS